MASKIIVIGSINGHFTEVFTKLTALHAKNNFALALIVGDLFAAPPPSTSTSTTTATATTTSTSDADLTALLSNTIPLPLPTYFALSHRPLPPSIITRLTENANELIPNLYFLGKRTTITTAEGIRIVALGGSLDANLTVGTSKDAYTPFYCGGDAAALRGARGADILITSDWPAGVENGSKVVRPTATTAAGAGGDEVEEPASHHVLADLCSTLKPRYHFSTSAFFYEREPFFHPPLDPTDPNSGYPTTRFLSLASYGNSAKQKWIYAFSLTPGESAPVTLPQGATASPFSFNSKKRPAPVAVTDGTASFSRFSSHNQHSSGGAGSRPHKRGRRHEPPPGPDSCFFCLSNPNLATHLIASIGTDAYLTTAKGPLLTSATLTPYAPELKCPAHILIIPLAHAPTLAAIPDPEARKATIAEMRRYRGALNAMVEKVSDGKLGSVTWEVSKATGVHTHWQWLPVERGMIEKGLVEVGMKVEGENEGWGDAPWGRSVLDREGGKEEEDEEEEDELIRGRGDVFRVWLWTPPPSSPSQTQPPPQTSPQTPPQTSPSQPPSSQQNGQTTLLTLPLSSDAPKRFNPQFGRRVLAKLLGLEGRMNWQDCAQSEGEETRDVEAFKSVLGEWDFGDE